MLQLRHDALIKQRASAANDEVVARRRYVAAVGAHAKGQAGAMRLCLDRLAFCASELSEQRAKRAKARTLGLGADVEADLSSTCATIERKYLEAEEGMNAVLAAGAALRWEAERVAPEALKTAVPGSSPAGGELISVFEEAAALRDAFVELERPSGFFNEEAVGGAMAAAAAEAGVDGFALGAGIPAVIQELPEEASTVEEKKRGGWGRDRGGGSRLRLRLRLRSWLRPRLRSRLRLRLRCSPRWRRRLSPRQSPLPRLSPRRSPSRPEVKPEAEPEPGRGEALNGAGVDVLQRILTNRQPRASPSPRRTPRRRRRRLAQRRQRIQGRRRRLPRTRRTRTTGPIPPSRSPRRHRGRTRKILLANVNSRE